MKQNDFCSTCHKSVVRKVLNAYMYEWRTKKEPEKIKDFYCHLLIIEYFSLKK